MDFPFEAYDCQLVYMEKVIEALQTVCTFNSILFLFDFYVSEDSIRLIIGKYFRICLGLRLQKNATIFVWFCSIRLFCTFFFSGVYVIADYGNNQFIA